MSAHPRSKTLGILGIVLGALGIVVGGEETLAGLFAGAWNDGGGDALFKEAGSGVLMVGLIVAAMSVFLLVVGILLALGRGWTVARIWGVLGALIAIGLTIDATTHGDLANRMAARGLAYPGYLSDLGGAQPIVLGLLVLLPIAMLFGGPRRKPLEAAIQ